MPLSESPLWLPSAAGVKASISKPINFFLGGSVGGGGIDRNNVDLPPENGGLFSLQTGWGSGGNPGFFGGFGRDVTTPLDLTGATHFSFWINPDPGQDYTLEINLQYDDNGDDQIAEPPDGADDEARRLRGAHGDLVELIRNGRIGKLERILRSPLRAREQKSP